jgi:hypothetical protein
MSYENVRLRKKNIVAASGYYWMIDEDLDAIITKTDDGTQAYSYPLDTTLTNEVVSLDHDGYNFWSLEQTTATEVTIRRWYLDNYVCKLRENFVFNSTNYPGTHFKSNAFSIEHYHVEFSFDEVAGQSVLSITDVSNMEADETLVLGPNSSGQQEEVTIQSVGAGDVTITNTTDYAYEDGDSITFYKNIWIFNDYYGTTVDHGALYKVDAYDNTISGTNSGGAYHGVNAATFFDMSDVFGAGSESIAYVKGTNILFMDPTDVDNSFGSLVMDNIEDDQATTINIYDITIEGSNVYRLQEKATYYGTTYTYSEGPYNYQLSTLNSFITSISLSADPAILPANGTNNSAVTAVVKDQFNLPVVSKLVHFSEDDDNGYIITSPVSTDASGKAETQYKAGTTAREVRITSTAQQS